VLTGALSLVLSEFAAPLVGTSMPCAVAIAIGMSFVIAKKVMAKPQTLVCCKSISFHTHLRSKNNSKTHNFHIEGPNAMKQRLCILPS